MHPIVRNVLAVLAGFLIGGIVNGGIISISHSIIPLPPGVDPNDIESIKANMHLYENIHFIMPFLAHALGTLVGALAAASIAATHKMKFALSIGMVFLAGGIYMATLLPAPMWFEATDVLLAYLPMAWIGGKLGQSIMKN